MLQHPQQFQTVHGSAALCMWADKCRFASTLGTMTPLSAAAVQQQATFEQQPILCGVVFHHPPDTSHLFCWAD